MPRRGGRSHLITAISNWLYKVAHGWLVLMTLILFLGFSALVLPDQTEKAEVYSSGVGSPDTSLFYSPDTLYSMAEAYGQVGRDAYIRARFSFDIIWPLVYAVFLVTSLSWTLRKAFATSVWFRNLNLLPVAGACFDYMENLSASIVFLRYPEETPLVDLLVPIFTLMKWILISGGFLLLVIGFLYSLWNSFRRTS